jgi:hypothetical protein
MTLNPFFLQGSPGEQNLVQDLINEQLKIYGVEIYYLPRSYVTEKTVIREVIESKFNNAYPIEAYVNNYDGYGDNTTILSKFGIQATNEVSLIISQERFQTYITPLIKNFPNIKLSTRPKEGDLVYFPLGDRLFEVKFVEHEKPFYMLQKNYTYELKCELFRYEDEILDTTIDEIDDNVITEGNITSLTLVGSGSTATAYTGVLNGAVNQIIVTNRGERYTSPPTVAISSSPAIGGRATGISTLIDNIINCDGTQIGSKVQQVYITNPGFGYTVNPGIVFISIPPNTGIGAAATTRISDGVVGIVTISSGGSGYTTTPTVTFSSPGIGTTATGIAVVSAAGSITNIYVTNGGSGYTSPPTVTISNPSVSGIGTFIFNEIITGSQSGTTARVKTWSSVTNILTISNLTGQFIKGESIVGSSSSASYKLSSIQEYNTVNNYPDNDKIEIESDSILDFSEKNPFGTP